MAQAKIIPIYNTKGDADAFLVYPYLYNRNGEWIGFVTPEREVYSVLGNFVGTLTSEPRIVAKRSGEEMDKSRKQPPPKPPRIHPSATIPLPPMMAELSHSIIDVLLEMPEKLHTVDSGEERQDMD